MSAIDSERIISYWQTIPGFPGRAGRPGKRDGYYPIEKIKEWRRSAGVRGGSNADEELIAAKKRLALLEIQEQELAAKERLGRLLDFGDVSAFLESCVANAKAVFGQTPDRVLACLPTDMADDVRTEIYRAVERLANDAFGEIAQLLEGDTDPTDDDDSDES